MKLTPLAPTIAALFLLSACGGSSNSATSTPLPTPAPDLGIATQYQGNWQAPGYGMSISISSDALKLYQFTSDYCLLSVDEDDVDTQDIESLLQTTDDTARIEWTAGFGTPSIAAPGIYFEKTPELPQSCQTNAIDMTEGTNNVLDSLELWELYGQIFSEYYLDFSLKNIDWQQLHHDAGQSLQSDSSALDLINAMYTTLEVLADGHNAVVAPQGWSVKFTTKPTLKERLVEEFANENNLPYPITEEYVTQDLLDEINEFTQAHLANQWELTANYAADESEIKTSADGLIRWFENQGLGYLYIGGMLGYADASSLDQQAYAQATIDAVNQALDLALTDLSSVNGLIIDVRTNDGGHDFVSLAIASRFTDSDVHVYSKQARDGESRTPMRDVQITPYDGTTYTGPIALLTSSSTVSAAEVFTLSMSNLPNVTLIGEATHGAFSDVLDWTLPNGFKLQLSNEYYLSPLGDWYEGQGVPVDIHAPFYLPEHREAEIDLAIEMAIEVLAQ